MKEIEHLGIIVDGNGRWAKERGLERSAGHLEGSKNLEKLILFISDEKLVKYLSLYVFSTENFSRDKKEVDYLMKLFMKWFNKSKKLYKDRNIKILFSGRKDRLDKKVIKAMDELEEDTKNNTGLVVNFCLNYGGRAEIVDASKKIVEDVLNNKISVNTIDEELFSKYLYKELPDVDFLIRTSGEMRVSNFMLWQISYAEFYFPDTYFPDFDTECLLKAFEEYKKRDRRFGKINNV